MEPLNIHKGRIALLDRNNIDTDQIIPKQFLRFIGKTGFGKYLFFDWRYLENGQLNPEFELNSPKFKGATILLAGHNFGCGSSREHAPWSLLDYGFKVIISTSFADIFWNNCFKNGMLPIVINQEEYNNFKKEINESSSNGCNFTINLVEQKITSEKQKVINFDIDQRKKEFLLKGIDDISYSEQFNDQIEQFESNQAKSMPWVWGN